MAPRSSSSANRAPVREIAFGLGGLYFVGVGAAWYFHAPGVVMAYLAAIGLVITASLLLQRGRYRASSPGEATRWKSTGERFRDPVSGRLMEVRSDPRTGKRAYVELPDPDPHQEHPSTS